MGVNEGTISKWLSVTVCAIAIASSGNGSINTWKILVICDNILDPTIGKKNVYVNIAGKYQKVIYYFFLYILYKYLQRKSENKLLCKLG